MPFFMSKIDPCLKEIKEFNEFAFESLGSITVKRSIIKYKGGAAFPCNRCDYAAKTSQH